MAGELAIIALVIGIPTLAFTGTWYVAMWWESRQRSRDERTDSRTNPNHHSGVPSDEERQWMRHGEEQGRQQALEEVRMVAHGHLKTHVLAVQRCLVHARDARSDEEQAYWIDAGLQQAKHLLETVVLLHQSLGPSLLPNDFEQTVVDVARSLIVAYPHVRCHVEVLGQKPAYLPDAIKRAASMVFYNAINNAYRHANPTTVTVHLQYATDALIVSISDDGCGMPEHLERTSGRGLRDMQAVVQEQYGELTIWSDRYRGTEVRAVFPLTTMPEARQSSPQYDMPMNTSNRWMDEQYVEPAKMRVA